MYPRATDGRTCKTPAYGYGQVSLASGIAVPYNMYEKADSETIKKILSANGISNTKCTTGNCNASKELVDILRGISRLASAPTANNWQDGENMKFLFVFEFTSDIMPNATTVNQLVARELIYNLVCSRPFLDNGDYRLCGGCFIGIFAHIDSATMV